MYKVTSVVVGGGDDGNACRENEFYKSS